MGRRILSDALSKLVNAERRRKATVELQPISTVISSFLSIMKNREISMETSRLKRQDVKAKEIEKYRLRTLPTNQWGYVVITTPDGVLDHEEALRRNVGGQVLGYFH